MSWKCVRLHFRWIVLMIMVNNGVQGWTYHYNTDSKMEWETARNWCRQHFTDMVAIQNQEEVAYLNNMLPHCSSYYWIGLRKMAGQWTWVGTMKPLAPEATSWATGEPNNQGTSEDCVEIYIKRAKDPGKWNDDRCTKKKAALCYTASCSESSCSEHAECVENIGNYTCKCNPGFTGPRCNEAVQCGVIQKPDQGLVQCKHVYGDFRFNSSCHFQCSRGYILHGSDHLHCSSLGKWDSDPPECQAIECPPIAPVPIDVNMTCVHPLRKNSYNSTCVFSCDEGFETTGSHTTLCDYTGHWTHNTPNCTAVTCDPLVTPVHGHMTCRDPLGKFSYRSSCSVTCEEGYTMRGENTLSCLKTGGWSAETPTCEVVRCSTLHSAPHGSMQCTNPLEQFAYSSSCRFECDVGFLLMGSNDTYCNLQGAWTHSLPVCQAVQCNLLSAHSSDVRMNCTHPFSTNSYNSTCVFNCDQGFELIGSNKTQCDYTGQWTPEIPTCKAVTCDPIVAPANGHMTCRDPLGNFSFSSSCSLSCEEGFTLSGENTLTCLKTATWSAGMPTCEAVTCDPLVTPVRGHMTCRDPLGKFSYRSSCSVTCEEGYTLRGENTLSCLKTGGWSAETPTCEVVRCSTLHSAPHGSMQCTNPLEQFAYSSSCRFECDVGFLLMGSNDTYCNLQGAWTHSLPVCQAVTCDPLVTPLHGHMTCRDPLGKSSFSSSCSVTCEEGFTLRGENTLTCLKTGGWSAETPTCEARQCPSLSSPEEGWMNCSHLHSRFSYGSRCSFGCQIGYMLRGESELNCLTAGTWSQEKPSCKVIQCESLLRTSLSQSNPHPAPFMNCSHPRGNFSFGSQCRFDCPESYRLNGTTELICISGGLWSDLPPACIVPNMPLGTALLLYIGIGAASSLGLLLTGGLIILLVRHFKKDKFSPDYSAWDGVPNPVYEDIL